MTQFGKVDASAGRGGIRRFIRHEPDGSVSRLRVVPARTCHLREVIARLRPRDGVELAAASGRTAPGAASRTFALSPLRWAAMRGGQCVALFGAMPDAHHAGVAVVWLFGTPDMERERRALVALGPLFVARMAKVWPVLVNMTLRDDGAVPMQGGCGGGVGAQRDAVACTAEMLQHGGGDSRGRSVAFVSDSTTLRWLARCGFAVGEALPLGAQGQWFYPFCKGGVPCAAE